MNSAQKTKIGMAATDFDEVTTMSGFKHSQDTGLGFPPHEIPFFGLDPLNEEEKTQLRLLPPAENIQLIHQVSAAVLAIQERPRMGSVLKNKIFENLILKKKT